MTTPVAPPAKVSVVDALMDAIGHTQRALFPMRFERWLALGLIAFLDQCGRGGASLGWPGHIPNGGGRPDVSGIGDWLGSHVGLVVLVAAVGLAGMILLTALVLWLSSRGIFMYVDNVASRRSDVGRPWHEHAERASSLFAWRFGLACGLFLAVVLMVAIVAAVMLAVSRARPSGAFTGVALLALIPFVLLFLLLAIVGGLASVALRDFVAPLQLWQGSACGAAVQTAWRLVREQPGVFVVYVLLKIAFSLVAGTVILTACCLTCGCVLLPVISQTLLQPLFYFERAFSLHVLRRLGYDLMAAFEPLAPPSTEPLPGAPDAAPA